MVKNVLCLMNVLIDSFLPAGSSLTSAAQLQPFAAFQQPTAAWQPTTATG